MISRTRRIALLLGFIVIVVILHVFARSGNATAASVAWGVYWTEWVGLTVMTFRQTASATNVSDARRAVALGLLSTCAMIVFLFANVLEDHVAASVAAKHTSASFGQLAHFSAWVIAGSTAGLTEPLGFDKNLERWATLMRGLLAGAMIPAIARLLQLSRKAR